MFVSVAADLPSLTKFALYKNEKSSIPLRRPRPPDRRAQPAEPRDRHRRTDPADRQGRGDLDRGQALRDQQRHRHPRHRARVRRRHRAQRRRPGRLDDRAAVHQERAPGPVPPHDLREAARGGARLPALAQVVQGKDHHRLPQHDLLRQRRLRDRGGGPDLLRPRSQPPRLRHCPATNCASNSSSRGRRRCWRASSSRPPPTTPPSIPSPPRSGAKSSCARCSTRAT